MQRLHSLCIGLRLWYALLSINDLEFVPVHVNLEQHAAVSVLLAHLVKAPFRFFILKNKIKNNTARGTDSFINDASS